MQAWVDAHANSALLSHWGKQMAFKIESAQQKVLTFIADVQCAADSEKEALGFMPAVAYEEAARKGEITLVLQETADGSNYAGHVWVSGTYPHARVVQLCVHRDFRGHRLSSRLLRAAIQAAEDWGYLTIKANVADNLVTANRVYEHHGFEHAQTKPGGKSRGRKIHVRVRELSTPTLFTYRPTRSAVVSELGALPEDKPLYLLDLNVFFDATRKRLATDAAGKIVAAALNNGVRLAVTAEFIKELERTSTGTNDPVLSFARLLPIVSGPIRPQIDALGLELAPIVFPNQTRDAVLSERDHSDLRHLAEAILVGAAGFVTGEKAIIRAQGELKAGFRLTVWSTEEFAVLMTPAFEEGHATTHVDHDLSFAQAKFEDETEAFLISHGATAETLSVFRRRDAADRNVDYVAAREAGTLIAFAAYRGAVGPTDQSRLLVVANQRHPGVPTAVDYLIERAIRMASAARPAKIELADVPGQNTIRRVAIANGFLASPTASGSTLFKICLGTVATPKNWADLRRKVQSGTGLELSKLPPLFAHDEQPIPVSVEGHSDTLALTDLESMMSPSLLLLAERSVAVVPIQRVWAEDLIGGSQLSLLAKPEAAFRSRRVYFASERNRRNLVRGRPVIMYESGKNGGRGAAIAVARVAKAEVLTKSQAPEEILRAAVVRGVQLEKLTKGTTVLAVWLDNIMRFETPVSYERMRSMGVDDKTQLVSSRIIAFDTATKIIEAGRPNAR